CGARRRHGGVHRTGSPMPGFRLQVRGLGTQYGARRGRRRGAERRVDAGGKTVGLNNERLWALGFRRWAWQRDMRDRPKALSLEPKANYASLISRVRPNGQAR